jgi:transposase-like protein
LIQEALQREFDTFIGAAPHARTPTRRGQRNGSYDRSLKTRIGSLTLRVPRDREGLFRPSLFAKYERSEQALVLSMVEMYFQGVSTRKVTDVVEVLCGTSISASEISALTRKLDVHLTAWRQRRLEQPYPYLIVDAHYERVRREGHVHGTAALWVVGVTADGFREHLGLWTGTSESAESWGYVFADLTKRGLNGVTYVVSDEHLGLRQALRKYFPDAVLQRCQVHYLRNAYRYVSNERTHLLLRRGLTDAFQAPTIEEARLRVATLITELTPLSASLAQWLQETVEEVLVCYVLEDDQARRMLRSTNALERHHLEVRRRTRVVNIFPHEASLLRLVTALVIEQNEVWSARAWIQLATARRARQSRPRHFAQTRPWAPEVATQIA